MENISTTPEKFSLAIKLFLKKIDIKGTPRLLPYTERNAGYSAGNCLTNCAAEAQSTNDKVVFGWTIWENRSAMELVAEFQGVMLVNGVLVDITPRVDGEEKIMFIPDPTKRARQIGPDQWETWLPGGMQNKKITQKPRQIILEKNGYL